MGVGCCTRCWTRQNTPRPLRGPLQRTCGPRTARGAALESLAAPLAPEKCVSTPKLRARSAALSKLIVRTEQNNFAGGGTVAGLVLWAPVAARRDEVRAGACGTNASGAENAPRYSVQDVGDSPKLPEAAPRRSPESWGGRGTFRGTARGSVATPPVPAQCVRRPGRGGRRNGYFKRLPWSKVPLLKTGAPN